MCPVNLEGLKNHYQRHPIVLYLGAGVSKGDEECRFGLPGWWGLLKEILRGDVEKEARGEVRLPDDPWRAADVVARECGGETTFQRRLIHIVRARQNYTTSQRQLSRSFLSVAPTLNAIAAFCARLRGQVRNVKGTRYDVGPNPRVHAVLTSNYDAFLEAAFSTKFIQPLLKPVAAYGSRAGRLDQIPVFHVHGYVPHPAQRPRRQRRPLLKRLVLTNHDYESAWNPRDAFGPTMAPQIHFLRHYTVLFIGFSFTDNYVCSLLEAIRREYSLSHVSDRRAHFAMIPASLFEEHGKSYFVKIGVNPIVYGQHEEIAALLGEVYVWGLTADYGSREVRLAWVQRKTHVPATTKGPLIRKDQYWETLLACRNGALPSRKTESSFSPPSSP